MKPIDMSRFKKDMTKKLSNISSGFNDPKVWIDTGNKAVNFMVSGDFTKGFPLGKVSVVAGESGCIVGTTRLRIRYKKNEKEE